MAKAVEIENFSYDYPDGTKALVDINLGIAGGEKVAVIGPNGAGKSTLLLAMSAFLKVSISGLLVPQLGQGSKPYSSLVVCFVMTR